MPKVLDDEKIFVAVMEVIVARGYSGATTKQLAEAAGMSEVTLFRKYENKLQLVKKTIAAIIEQSSFNASTAYTGNIQADLLRILQAYEESVILHGRFFLALFSEVSKHPELIDSFDQPIGLFYSIGQLLARYQAEGILIQEHPLHTTASLLGPIIYGEFMRSTIPAFEVPPLNLENHVQNFLRGRYQR